MHLFTLNFTLYSNIVLLANKRIPLSPKKIFVRNCQFIVAYIVFVPIIFYLKLNICNWRYRTRIYTQTFYVKRIYIFFYRPDLLTGSHQTILRSGTFLIRHRRGNHGETFRLKMAAPVDVKSVKHKV